MTLPHTTHFYISNNEEIGYGGNSNVPAETVEYLAVDMGAIGDGQTSDEYTVLFVQRILQDLIITS